MAVSVRKTLHVSEAIWLVIGDSVCKAISLHFCQLIHMVIYMHFCLANWLVVRVLNCFAEKKPNLFGWI